MVTNSGVRWRKKKPLLRYGRVLQARFSTDRHAGARATMCSLRRPHMKQSSALRLYLGGLCATFAGAWVTDSTGSMLPLAMGASVALMCTVPLVSKLWARRRH